MRLTTHHDPVPEAIDDEYTLVVLIDLAPMDLMRQALLAGVGPDACLPGESCGNDVPCFYATCRVP